MTFEEWRATRQEVDRIDVALGTTCGEGPGFVYAASSFIEFGAPGDAAAGRYLLVIENFSACSDDLDQLERLLWKRWAVHQDWW